MPRPRKAGEKKQGGFSISAAPTEREAIKYHASQLGFSNVGRYFLALHEGAQRLGLGVEISFNRERWFVATAQTAASIGTPVPQDITVDDAIRQQWEDHLKVKGSRRPRSGAVREYEHGSLMSSLHKAKKGHESPPPAR